MCRRERSLIEVTRHAVSLISDKLGFRNCSVAFAIPPSLAFNRVSLIAFCMLAVEEACAKMSLEQSGRFGFCYWGVAERERASSSV